MKISTYTLVSAILLAAQALSAAPKQKAAPKNKVTMVPPTPTTSTAKPQAAVVTSTPLKATTTINTVTKPLDLKLLVLTGDGTEPSFGAIKYFLDYLGAPYDAVITKTAGLPALNDAAATHGYYNGVILVTGNLSIGTISSSGLTTYASALTATDWTRLDTYVRDFKVRTASYYTFPEARFGIDYISAISTTDTTPAYISITPAGQSVFSYMNPSARVKNIWSYTYYAKPTATPAAGDVTTPILTMNNNTVGVLHTKADGREYMAMTFDNNQALLHSMAFNYGMINWVTRGVFLGARKIYLTPQADDLFLSSDMFLNNTPACQPVGVTVDPTFNPSSPCPETRIAGSDFSALANWQDQVNRTANFANFKVTHAYNAYGTTPDAGFDNDTLSPTVKALRSKFFFLSHTFDHENLDCYSPVPNSGVCTPADYGESLDEITQNAAISRQIGLNDDTRSMVTPGISGLSNPAFLQAAVAGGLKYFVSDLSRPEWQPATPNTGVYSPIQPSLFIIPRRATNIFYNVISPSNGGVGSETDEYNFLFGPNGYFRVGGPGGPPFFSTVQSYSQIIDRESDNLLTYMLRYELYPQMYHQANFYRHTGNHSLFTDLIDATISKYNGLMALPVTSLKQSDIGAALQSRMLFNAAGVKATYTPGLGVTITATKAATIPITGACSTGCERYGNQSLSKISISAGQTVTIPQYLLGL